MNADTRALIKEKAGLSLAEGGHRRSWPGRVSRKENRPLLAGKEPLDVLTAQARDRYPSYAEADIAVETGDTPHQVAVEAIIQALSQRAEAAT